MLKYTLPVAALIAQALCVQPSLVANPSWQISQEEEKNAPQQEEFADNDPSPRSNPRWVKDRSSRQEYLKGGNNYPKSQSTSFDENQEARGNLQGNEAPRTNPRWVKDSAARERYLQGGSDYPHPSK